MTDFALRIQSARGADGLNMRLQRREYREDSDVGKIRRRGHTELMRMAQQRDCSIEGFNRRVPTRLEFADIRDEDLRAARAVWIA